MLRGIERLALVGLLALADVAGCASVRESPTNAGRAPQLRSEDAPLAGKAAPSDAASPDSASVDSASVELRIVDEHGHPIPAAALALECPAGPEPDDRARTQGPSVATRSIAATELAPGRVRIDALPREPLRVFAHVYGRHWGWTPALDLRARAAVDGGEIVLGDWQDRSLLHLRLVPADGVSLSAAERVLVCELQHPDGSVETRTPDVQSDGRFLLSAKPEDRVSVEMRDLRLPHGPKRWEGLRAGSCELELALPAAPRVPVLVTDSAGAPVESYDLRVWQPSALSIDLWFEGLYAPEPDDHPGGRAELLWPAWPCELKVEARGFRLERRAIGGPDAPALLEIRLERASGLRGRVTRAGRALADARVELVAASPRGERVWVGDFATDWEPEPTRVAHTEADGRFALLVPQAGDWYVRASAHGSAPANLGPFAFDEHGLDTPLELELTPGGSIEGRVVGAEPAACSGIAIGASNGDGRPLQTTTDAEGRFAFAQLTPGRWWVQRLSRGAAQSVGWSSGRGGARMPGDTLPFNCEVVDGRATRFELDLGQVPRLQGRLLFGGRLPSARMQASLSAVNGGLRTLPLGEATLDADGGFEVRGDVAGSYRLEISSLVAEQAEPADVRIRIEVPLELRAGVQHWSWEPQVGALRGTLPPEYSDREWGLLGVAPNGGSWRVWRRLHGPSAFQCERVPVGTCRLVWSRFTPNSFEHGEGPAFEVRAGETTEVTWP